MTSARPLATFAAIVVAGCAGAGGASPDPAGSPAVPSAESSPGVGSATFTNPVIDADFPDPHVIRADDAYFAYATTDGEDNIRVASSADLIEWQMLPDALPELASWSGPTPLFSDEPHTATWAPAVIELADRYVMYYTTPALDRQRPDGKPAQCIGVATSSEAAGPFIDRSAEPIVCQADLGGSIDATPYVASDGTAYLAWKNDGNCCAIGTRFFIQPLAEDGLTLVGEPTDMGVSDDARWERSVIEAPTLHEHDGNYYLFYSGNSFDSVRYAVGYATADDVLGPYADAAENPLLAAKPPAGGPGHQGIVRDDDGDLWLTFHAWDIERVGYGVGGRRAMWIEELVFEGGKPVVLGPDAGPQPVP